MNSFYNNYYKHYIPYIPRNPQNNFNNNINKENLSNNIEENKNTKKTSRYTSFGPLNFKNPLFCDIEEPIFEIFGIELYLDDIIILGLLFFLYKEGVQDEMLFITLILLLIT